MHSRVVSRVWAKSMAWNMFYMICTIVPSHNGLDMCQGTGTKHCKAKFVPWKLRTVGEDPFKWTWDRPGRCCRVAELMDFNFLKKVSWDKFRISLSIHDRSIWEYHTAPLLNLYWALQVLPAWGRCFQKVQRLDNSNARQQLCSCWMWCDLPLLHPRPFRERPERYCSNHHAEWHQQFVGSNLYSEIFGSLFVSERHHFVRLCFWCVELCTFELRTEFLLSLHHGSDFWPRCDFRSSDSSTVYELRSTWRDGKSPRSCEFCSDYYSWTWSQDF